MNFIEEYINGQKGDNLGLYMGEGLHNLSEAIGGIQKNRLYYIASPPKTGKSTLVNYVILNVIKDAIEKSIPIKVYYYSLEMSRIDLEFDFIVYFLYEVYKITTIDYENKTYPISPDLLRGRVYDENKKLVKVPIELENKIKIIYKNYLIKYVGEYNKEGLKISEGIINIIEISDNPTGIYNSILREAEKYGTFIKKKYGESERIIGYKPNNPNEYRIVVLDHVRKVYKERDFSRKEIVDKLSEYFVILRNLLKWTFIGIVHLNRNLNDTTRFTQFGDLLHPDSDMVKESGNLAEDCNYLITMFNPNDERYNLSKHFGLVIKDGAKNILYPYLRTLHLVESRHTIYPQHFRVNMLGNIKHFKKFKK